MRVLCLSIETIILVLSLKQTLLAPIASRSIAKWSHSCPAAELMIEVVLELVGRVWLTVLAVRLYHQHPLYVLSSLAEGGRPLGAFPFGWP